jgi:cleavage and polyadenylation specificity factor subunit 1
MEVYNQFVNPTTSLSGLYCHFTKSNDDNLIVSKGNLLQVFKLVDVSIDLTKQDFETIELEEYKNEKNTNYKLILISEYSLNGKILDIHKFRPDNENIDFLLVSTETAKISIVKWNPSDHLISVISLHYYEIVLESMLMEKLKTSDVTHRTDPNNGCTIMHVDDLFIFLPFKKDESIDDFELNDDYKPTIENKHNVKILEIESISKSTLFDDSFLLNAKTLHSDLKNIVDIQFLHSYRNPTIAILYAPETESWTGYLPEAKDNMKVIVLSLDLQRKSADVIIEVDKLPYDLERIIPLQHPINGFLLMGSNEIIHINSLGSTKGVYVNEFFLKTSLFELKDQENLDLFLDLSEVCQVSDSEVLLITKEGKFYTLVFEEIGGVSNLNRIVMNDQSKYLDVKISCVLNIINIPGKNIIFISSQGSDAMLINWEYQLKNQNDIVNNEIENDIFDGEEDIWLYQNDETKQNDELNTSLTNCKFTVLDKLINMGPLSDFTTGYISLEPKLHGLPNPNFKDTTIIGASGLDDTSALSILTPTVKPLIKSSLKFSNASKIWTVKNHNGETKYLITTDQKTLKTQIFEVSKGYKEFKNKKFRSNSFTIQFGTLSFDDKIRPVQVLSHKIHVYNLSFGHLATLTFDNEINHSIIHENYIVVLMKTGEIDILEYDDETRQLNKMDLPALLNFLIFTNAWISKSSLLNHATPVKKRDLDGNIVEGTQNFKEEVLFWLVTADNRLLVFRKDHLEKVHEFKNIHKMSEYLQLSNMDPNYEADVDPILKQCIYTKLGDKYDNKNYLIILTFGGEIIMYESFFDPIQQCFRFIKSNNLFQLPITGAPGNSYSYATKIERNLFKIDNLQGSNVVMVTGAMPFMIYKQYNSFPRMFKFTSKALLYFASFSTSACLDGLITIDDKKSCRMIQIDYDFDYSNKLPIKKYPIGQTINKVAYHEASNLFLISTLKQQKFNLLDAEGNDTIEYNKNLRKPAVNYRGQIQLVSPEKWTVIDTFELNENEICTSLSVLDLKNNGTDSKRISVFIGTGIFQSEDVPTSGSWKIYDIINVVPEPGKPEAKFKLKPVSSETAKGPVLDACSVDGRFAVIQGQRMLVRMLKSDGNAAPVAFTDTSLYSAKIKAFENLMLVGDSYQSVSLYGFDAEPYRMLPLAKDEHKMKLTECEFIVHNQNLYILASDENSILHVLQYDPYDAKSLKGNKLIRKSAFRSNSDTTKMITCNRRSCFFSMVNTLPIRSDVDLGFEVIGSNSDGSFYKVSPINEYQYRRLYALQNYIADKEHHLLGLNPKMNAIGNLQDEIPLIKRPFIEFKLLTKFSSMNEDKKKMFAIRLGKDALVDIYRDMISLQ